MNIPFFREISPPGSRFAIFRVKNFMKKHLRSLPLLAILAFFQLENLSAQVTGGRHVFQFLTLSPSARVTALGGYQIAVQDDDLALAQANPAALNARMDGRLTFNHNFYLADIGQGYFAVAKHLKTSDLTLHAGIRYIKYGDIPQADETGLVTGKIQAGETAYTLGAGKKLSERFTLGLNLTYATSTLDSYHATAIAADAGLLYVDSAAQFTAALVFKNKGSQLVNYNDVREPLPYDLQFAVSKRLAHLPLRLTMTAHHLQVWDIRYDDPALNDNQFLIFGENQSQNAGNPFFDILFRHLVFSGELALGRAENFRLRLGYNHLRHQELSVSSYRSLAGFSAGIGLKISKFRVDFGWGGYHLAGGVAHFSLGTNLHDFFKG